MNLDQRPDTYFDDAIKAFLATIKGKLRKREAQDRIQSGDLSELEDFLLKPSLSEVERAFTSSIHPALMGGEYLPDFLPAEVEIARIELESVTADVISVRARLSRGKIHYRFVNEYESSYVVRPAESNQPLTLGELSGLIDSAKGDLEGSPTDIWERQFTAGLSDEEIASFVTVTSDFYPDITEYYEERFEEWLEEARSRPMSKSDDPCQLELNLSCPADETDSFRTK